MNNVLSFRNSIDNGFEPSQYIFKVGHFFEDNSEIELYAMLDFKIWLKKVSGISCMFSTVETKHCFRISIFKTRDTEEFKINSSHLLEFKTCPINCVYKLRIQLIKNMPKLIDCELIEKL